MKLWRVQINVTFPSPNFDSYGSQFHALSASVRDSTRMGNSSSQLAFTQNQQPVVEGAMEVDRPSSSAGSEV